MTIFQRFRSYLLSFRWGGHSLASLYISVVSGVVLAWQYDLAEPFYSSTTLELVTPFGSFWRSCHFYSSQAFFILLLLHFLVVLINRTRLAREEGEPATQQSFQIGENWGRLYLALPVSLLLLFTGYVLRGDATGEAAGLIGENIILSLPVAGRHLNAMLFNISQTGMRVVYANHLIGLMVVGGGLAWIHLRRYRIRIGDYGGLVVILLAFSLVVPAPLEPFRVGVFPIAGPWFFIGVQELLRYLQPVWGGIVFPIIAVALGYRALIVPGDRRSSLGLGVLLIIYLALSMTGIS
jgi:ubiquinol-cytochrome c reductase cytochrome b subunit